MSLADPATVAVLKSRGGYTKLVEQTIDEQLQRLAGNPRVGDRLGPLRTALRVRVPAIRQRVQALIARTPFHWIGEPADGDGTVGGRGSLASGFYPEVELRAIDLRMVGRPDLLTVKDDGCEITDFKTGAAESHHHDQIRLYALLWNRDTELNAQSLPVRRLVLAHASNDIEVDPPSEADLGELAAATAGQISEAEEALRERPPAAYPEAAMCGVCGVRQLCSEYWDTIAQVAPGAEWFDVEGTVTKRNGSRSWLLATSADKFMLLRCASEFVPFGVGDHVRLLDLHRDDDPESPILIATLTGVSEVFTVRD